MTTEAPIASPDALHWELGGTSRIPFAVYTDQQRHQRAAIDAFAGLALRQRAAARGQARPVAHPTGSSERRAPASRRRVMSSNWWL